MENPLQSGLAMIPVGLTILSLVLVNAQGVTALTSERDTGALDLLLVTELSPKEFIYGKLYGVLYNSKEMIALPVLSAIGMAFMGYLSGENLVFFLLDFLLLCHFAAMLGLHAAITYTSSRTAVANSLGTIFFLMVGILLCSFLIALSDREFGRQLLSFMIFIGAGSVALFGSLGAKNPSQCHRAGLDPDAVLDVLLHHQPGQRRPHGRVPGQCGRVWLRHPRHARPGRRRLRHRPGPDQRDPGMSRPDVSSRRRVCFRTIAGRENQGGREDVTMSRTSLSRRRFVTSCAAASGAGHLDPEARRGLQGPGQPRPRRRHWALFRCPHPRGDGPGTATRR